MPPNAVPPPPVTGEHQWLEATTGRIAPSAYAWLQAVHWIGDLSGYAPSRGHGPQFGPTTLRIARLLAHLTPCRPGVAFLARTLAVSERTVQYHLDMLRESGLIAYITKGTRRRGETAIASVFARLIPASFDAALDLRTTPSTTHIRTVTGAAPASRTVLARLGAKAARTLAGRARRRGRKAPPKRRLRCTPMESGTCSVPRDGSIGLPSESTAAPHGPRALNAVGRRHRLAQKLVRQVPWLHLSDPARVAWAVRDVSDSGWRSEEVLAVLAQQAVPALVHRPVGFLTGRLAGAHLLYDTAAKRDRVVAWWRDSPTAEHERHAAWQAELPVPRSIAVRRMVALSLSTPQTTEAEAVPSREQQAHVRQMAWSQYLAGRPDLVLSAVRIAGPRTAADLYGEDLVTRVMRLSTTGRYLRTGPVR
ncbi:transcriptional regulator [Kitasatospora sp. NPDC088783]|uniref:transcriptional regulator n=1 Tax=Kitasatospora sp. NPDC088783 TaxID=3364077 RepID=UPI0038050268